MIHLKHQHFTKDNLIEIYKKMLLLRRFEEKAGQLYGMGQISGFCHLYIGQEAVAIGVQYALSKDDSIITSYRDHGIMLATGSDPKAIMAELLGKETGCSKGKGGSMHMFDLEKKFYGGHGIVAAQVPIGTGIAFAEKYNGTKNVSVVYFGDGAANQGQVYESFNMAKLWNLPVLYIIENNEYAMGTSVKRASGMTELYKRGYSFGIPGVQVNGMDFFDVHTAVEEIVQEMRAEGGPRIIEMKTYRYRGHSMSDPAKYRTKEEVALYKEKKDPLDHMAHYLKTHKVADDKLLEKIEEEVIELVRESVEFAQNSAEPSERELYRDIYV